MRHSQLWAQRARYYLLQTLKANRDDVAEALLLHEPGCPTYDAAWDLVELCGHTVPEFLKAWDSE